MTKDHSEVQLKEKENVGLKRMKCDDTIIEAKQQEEDESGMKVTSVIAKTKSKKAVKVDILESLSKEAQQAIKKAFAAK